MKMLKLVSNFKTNKYVLKFTSTCYENEHYDYENEHYDYEIGKDRDETKQAHTYLHCALLPHK